MNGACRQTTKQETSKFSDFLECARSKDVVLFGVGPLFLAAKKLLAAYNIDIAYAVDNNFWKHGSCVEGVGVYMIDRLIHADPQSVCVLICTQDVFSVEAQLKEMGVAHYFALPRFAKELYTHGFFGNMEIPLMEMRLATLDIMLVNQCNLRCKMCEHALNSTGEAMPFERYAQVLEQCRSLRILGQKVGDIRLDGNREALLHPRFCDIVREIKRQGFNARLVTNGVLMSGEILETVAEYVGIVNISLTGVTPETYHHFQGSNRANSAELFLKATQNVRELIKRRNELNSKLKIRLSFVCNAHSVHEAYEAIDSWKQAGVDIIGVNIDNRELVQPYIDNERGTFYIPGFECINKAIVSSNGDVFPCCRIAGEYMPLGNCFKTPLNEIFQSEEYFSLCRSLATLKRETLPEGCRTCSAVARVHS